MKEINRADTFVKIKEAEMPELFALTLISDLAYNHETNSGPMNLNKF